MGFNAAIDVTVRSYIDRQKAAKAARQKGDEKAAQQNEETAQHIMLSITAPIYGLTSVEEFVARLDAQNFTDHPIKITAIE